MEMEKLVSLCKRRGFLFQSSEIYGGLNGFWDYGPLGVELKRNIKEAWWRDMVTGHDDLATPPGAPEAYEMTGLDATIIMHPQIWKCSGHYDLFHDMMADCRETKKRYRFDHLKGRWAEYRGQRVFIATQLDGDEGLANVEERACKYFGVRKSHIADITFGTGQHGGLAFKPGAKVNITNPSEPYPGLRPIWDADTLDNVLAPDASKPGTLTEPREFNLMFKTIVGAMGTEEDAAFLRPETAQGIFVNFKNVLDSSRVRVPFGIAQMGKSFRNEITPRNFTFRSREFEQMEIEFFCHPGQSAQWYKYWRDRRFRWYTELGLASNRLQLREHDKDELSHYSCGTADIEYAFPFLAAGEFGELEGIAHRGDFDLRSHMEGKLVREGDGLVVEKDAEGKPRHRGSGKDLSYRDDITGERFTFCRASDLFSPRSERPRLITWARSQPAKSTFVVHGYASESDGTPTQNVNVSCHRAKRVARELYNAGKDGDIAMIVPGGPTLMFRRTPLNFSLVRMAARCSALSSGRRPSETMFLWFFGMTRL
jgi:glycyl-tRNA synthetase